MPPKLIFDGQGLAAAIDAFSADYHQDFDEVRSIAVKYLEQTGADDS